MHGTDMRGVWPVSVRVRRTSRPAALLLALAVLATLVAACSSAAVTAPDPEGGTTSAPAQRARPLEIGVNGSTDPSAIRTAGSLGTQILRVEFTIDSPLSEVEAVARLCADNGIRLQPLVGWPNGTPAPDLTPLAQWARVIGPGGSAWQGRSTPYAVTDIELGNENAFTYKSGDVDGTEYSELATAYGERARDAARAVREATPDVSVLVELESADTERSTWIDNVLRAGGPDLARLMRAPVSHAYGPDWSEKIDRDRRFLAVNGVTKPTYLTEWGIASDNGVALDDNYGYPTDLTYDQAGQELTSAISGMAARPDIGQVLLYQLTDQRTTGFEPSREYYFGILTLEGNPKGGYTQAARTAISGRL